MPSNLHATSPRHRATGSDFNSLALEFAPAAFAVTSLAGHLLYANRQFLELCGPDAAATGVAHGDIRTVSGQRIGSALLDAVIKEGGWHRAVIAWPTATGQPRDMLCGVSRVSNEGMPVCLALVLQDVSALAAAHRRQRDDMSVVQRLLRASSWRLSLDAMTQGQSTQWQSLPLTWQPQPMAAAEQWRTTAPPVPATLRDYFKCVAPDDCARLVAAIDEAIAQRGGYDVEYELRWPKGQVRRIHASGTVAADDSTTEYKLIGVEIDVTHRARSVREDQPSDVLCDALLEGTDSPVYIVDRKLRYLRFNSAYETLLIDSGGTPVRIGDSILDTIVDPVRRRYLGALLTRVLKGERLIDGTSFVGEASAAQQWFDFSFSPVRGAQGRIEGVVAFGKDISPLKRADHRQQQLNQELMRRVEMRTAELSAANQDLNAFVSSVSHDLQSPLRSLEAQLSFAEAHRGDADPTRLAEHFRKAHASIARMRVLVEDLLKLSRVGRQALQAEDIDMSRLVQEILQDLAAQSAGRDLEIDVTRLPALRADSTLVRQVFQNLLSNAIKFTRDCRPGRISVRATQSDGELVWSVGDNGLGFNMEQVDTIFAPFVQLHDSFSKQGSGIGLTIVKRALDQMAGRIWVQSSPGQGATFHFTLGSRMDGMR